MKEEKIPIFASVPTSELTNISEDKTDTTDYTKLRSIEREFEQTNKHTQQTNDNTNKTANTGNTDNSTEDSAVNSKPERKNRLGSLMKGTLAVDLVDMLIPSMVVLLINYFGYVLEKKDLQLSKSEKEALSPAVQDVLDEIQIDFSNPWINLTVMLGIVYGSKIMDKLPEMKKKTKSIPVEKKGMTEAVNSIVTEAGEAGENNSYLAFEIDYGKLVDSVRLERRRGVGDAKEYLATNYNEKIKAIAAKHNVPYDQIQEQLNFTWTPKKRKSRDNSGFDVNNL